MSTQTNLDPASHGSWTALRIPFDDAVAKLPAALSAEGFGVITQVDMQATLKAKLGVDMRRYRIFGVCKPALARQALETDPRAGLLLPCNVVLFEQDDGTATLGVVDPAEMLGGDARLAGLAETVGGSLRRFAASMQA